MYKLIAGVAFGLLLFGGSAMAACSSYPYTLTNGTTADASQVMANFNCSALTSGATLTNATQIGIGMSPVYPLDVEGGSAAGSAIARFDATNAASSGAGIRVSYSGITEGWLGYGGFGVQFPSATTSDFGIGSRARIGLDSGGASYPVVLALSGASVGIGTATPSYTLHVNGSVAGTGAYNALSDIRHKKDVASLENGALDDVMHLRPVTFLWKEAKDDGMRGRQMGFIAQEVEQVLPSVVLTENNAEKTKGLKYNEIIAVLTKAVQEQQAEINALKAVNDNDKAVVGRLQTRLEVVERQARVRTAQR